MSVVMEEKLSVKTVRKACLDCSGDSAKYVIWCPCDGLHSTRCDFWPFRLGMKPATVRSRYGDRLVTPEKMPPPDVELDRLPDGMEKASTAAIDLEGYSQPTVEVKRKPKRELSPEEREAFLKKMNRGKPR